MSGVACEDARTFPVPPPRPRLQFSVGNTGFLHFHAGIRTDIPHLPRSNTSLKFLKRFMQAFPTSLTLVLRSPAPIFGFLHLRCLQIPFPRHHLQSSHSPLIPDSSHPDCPSIHRKRSSLPRCAPSTPQISSISRSTRRLPRHIPLRPPSLRQSKSQSRICLARASPSETNQADIAEFGSHSRPN